MNIFKKKPDPKGFDREIGSLQLEEKKLVAEIKKTAKSLGDAIPAPASTEQTEPKDGVLSSDDAYALVLGHRRLRVNSVQILQKSLMFGGTKSEMNIPLCRMISMQVICPALAVDIEKMKADFIHGYRLGAAIFYVSTTDFIGNERWVTESDRAMWDKHWQAKDREFENFLASDLERRALSNKFFFVWDGNHRHLAWTEFIARTYEDDITWHYRVRSIFLNTKDDVTAIITAMHDINKSTESSHVKTNMVHTLHRMQKVGNLPVTCFRDLLSPEELASAINQAKALGEKKSWYPIPRIKFLEYIHSQDIVEVGDEAQRKYEDETEASARTSIGLTNAISAAMEAKRQKLSTAFTKYLSIANPANGASFLMEIAKHWSVNLSPKMTMEKLQLLATSCNPSSEKEAILQIWNSSRTVRLAKRFPTAPFSDANFTTYLHKHVFWYQLKIASMELLPSLLAEARCTEKTSSVTISQDIDSSRGCQWEYVFVEQIKSKEINKSLDWESSKNIHREPAMHRLVYRYWLHILMKEEVALEESSNFVDWCDSKSDKRMYTLDQIEDWNLPHLKQCHWYIEMPTSDTPPHEEENRRFVDLMYQRVQGRAHAVSEVPMRGTASAARTIKTVKAKVNVAKEGALKSNSTLKGCKRAIGASARESAKRGKIAEAEVAQINVAAVEVKQSKAKSSKSQSVTTKGHGPGFTQGLRDSLVIRDKSERAFEYLIVNKSFADFMSIYSPNRKKFERFSKKVLGTSRRHIGGDATNKAIIHLVLVDQPSDTFVCGIPVPPSKDSSPPE